MRKLIIIAALMAVLPAGLGCAPEPQLECAQEPQLECAPEPQLETEEQKTLYALGVTLSGNLAAFNLTPDEVKFVNQGLADGALGEEPKVDVGAQRANFQKLVQSRLAAAAEKEKEKSAAYLETAAKQEGAVKSDSGLIYKEVAAGDGPSPKPTDRVTVHYHGTRIDGSVFDSSVERGSPATFPLNGVIPCWTEGVQKMKKGGKAQLICPSEIAYGDRGSPPKIKPGATLIFDVELLEIADAPPAPQKPPGHP